MPAFPAGGKDHAGARVEGTRKPAGAAGSAVPSGKAHMSPRASSRSASHQASSRGAAGTFGTSAIIRAGAQTTARPLAAAQSISVRLSATPSPSRPASAHAA